MASFSINARWNIIGIIIRFQNGSVELNLTEWLQATDNGNSSATTNDQQDTALDLAASLLIGMTSINDILDYIQATH